MSIAELCRRLARRGAALALTALALAAEPASAQLTTIGDGTNPSSGNVCPGQAAVALDSFTLSSTGAGEVVSRFRVRLSPATAFNVLESLEIRSDDLSTTYGSAVPTGEIVDVMLATTIAVTGAPVQYKITVKPKALAALPPPGAGQGFSVGATVYGVVVRYARTLQDASSALLTIDTQAPQDVRWSSLSTGATNINLAWTPPADGTATLLLRRLGGPVTERPAQGASEASYAVGSLLGGSTVRLSGAGTALNDNVGIVTGKPYYYRAFVKDACGNWSLGGEAGPIYPGGTAEGDLTPNSARPVVGIINPASGVVTSPFRVQARVFSPGSQPITNVTLSWDDGTTPGSVALVQNSNYGSAADSGVFETGPIGTGLTLAAGRYTLRVQATNGTGTVSSGPIAVVVNAGKGDGNLLVRDNSSQLCADCHAIKTHSAEESNKKGSWYVGCRTCHTPHNTANAALVRDQITPPAVNGQWPPANVYFSTRTGFDPAGGGTNTTTISAATYANADHSGPCQVCHTRTSVYTRTSGPAGHFETQCSSCHQHTTGFTASCTGCHGTQGRAGIAGADALVAAAPPAGAHGESAASEVHVGEHLAHVNQATYRSAPLACADCHAGYQHADGDVDLGWSQLASSGTAPGFGGAADPICSNVYCHTRGGSNPTPSWTAGQTLTCGSCHGAPPAAPHAQNNACAGCHGTGYDLTGITGAARSTHINGGVEGASCTGCHGDDTRIAAAGADSMVQFAPPRDHTGATAVTDPQVGAHEKHVNNGASTIKETPLACAECHTGYQHGDGDVDIGFGPLATTGGASPTWNGAATPTCTSTYCHAGMPGGSTPQPSWTSTAGTLACDSCHGAPPPIAANHPQNTSCGNCHNGYTGSSVNTALHVNGAVEPTAGSGCTACHGTPGRTQVSVVGTADANLPASPPIDTTGASASTADGVGAHLAHADPGTAKGLAAPFSCDECHTVPGAGDVSHADGAYAFSPGAIAIGLSYVGGNCSNTYCHALTGAGGLDPAPTWIGGAAETSCTSCHLAPPPVTDAGHPQNTTCSMCHSGYTSSSVTALTHVDGTVQHAPAAGCTQCHGDLTASGVAPGAVAAAPGANAGAVDSKGNTATSAVGVGAHREHLTTNAAADAFACTDCHPANYAVGDVAHANATPAVPLNGLAKTGGAPASYASPTCSSVYCHSRAFPVGGTQSYATVTFTSTITGCTACHDGGGAASTNLSSRHGRHVNSAASGNYAYGCVRCHSNVVSSDTTISAGGLAVHVDGQRSWGFDALNPSGSYATGTYTCSSVYCHSNGSPLGGTIAYANLTWNAGTVNATCTSCHGGDSTSGSNLVTNAHGAHVNQAGVLGTNYGCVDCHNTTVTGNRTLTNPPTQHVDGGVKDVGFAVRAGGQTSGAYASPNCSTVYCHSSGQATPTYVPVAWNGAARGCNGCHGTSDNAGAPDYGTGNSHPAHVTGATAAERSAKCQNCHSGFVTAAGTAISGARHTDGVRDVAILATFDANGATSNYNLGTKTCTSITCHGAGSPVWGNPTTATCSSCHTRTAAQGGDQPNWLINDDVAAIINSDEWTGSGHGNSATTFNEFTGASNRCLYCHDATVDHETATNPFRLRGAANASGITGVYDALSAKNGNEVCLNCHDTSSTVAYGVDPDGASAEPRVCQATGANPCDDKIDSWHYGAKHATTRDGGNRCWDCHDPHGDGNITMIAKRPVRDSTDDYGFVATRVTIDVSFTATTAASNFVNTTTRNGVCQVCHTTTNFWQATADATRDAHQSTTVCLDCHDHHNPPNFAFKGQGDCTLCHASSQPMAAGGTRRPIVQEFNNTWSHKRTAGGAVVMADCIVCHMEGDATTQSMSAVHGDGVINLRDPDTGANIKQATWGGSGAGSYTSNSVDVTFTRFSRNLGVTLEADPAGTIVKSIMINQCLKCHDSNGAADPSARVPTASGGEYPFDTTIVSTYYVGIGITAGGLQGAVVNVDASFATTNASYHPIKGKQNNWYAKNSTRMTAPWNTATRTGTVGTASWGYLMSCWDCHANPNDPTTITSTVTAHGGANTVRGQASITGTPGTANAVTLCNACHARYNTCGSTSDVCNSTTSHGTGSAFSSNPGRSAKSNFLRYGCNKCHGADLTVAVPRPYRAEDTHGFDRLPQYKQAMNDKMWPTGTTETRKPYGFIRNTRMFSSHQPARIGGTTYQPTCVHLNDGVCTSRTETYTVGGTY